MVGQAHSEATRPDGRPGPDPFIGAAITFLGIFLMGVGGARDLQLLFDGGALLAGAGAGVFVLFVALAAMTTRGSGGGPSLPPLDKSGEPPT